MKQYRNIVYLSDVTGTGFWRHIQQMLTANSQSSHLQMYNTYTQIPVLDQSYYNGMTSVTVQRWLSPQQTQIFTGFLKPVCDAYGAWLIYAIDDAMHYDEIPLYNKGRAGFADDNTQKNIKTMLNAADFVVVTTPHIKQYYHTKYDVPLCNILAVPNLLPRWWIGGKFNLQQKLDEKNANKARPRIGIISSLSHYNFKNFRKTADGRVAELDQTVNKWKTADGNEVPYESTFEIKDDVDQIYDTIVSTVDDFQWILIGYCPEKLKKYVDEKKIEVHRNVSILNYPNMISALKLQAVVAPLIQSEFNYCKSPIKYLECCALGIPLYATRCLPYVDVMDDAMLFSNNDELKEKLVKLKFMSTGIYKDIISKNFQWLNSPHEYGDFNLKNYWLDDNMGIWYKLFRLRQKTIHVNFDMFKNKYQQQLKTSQSSTIYSKNGIEIIK